MGVRKQFFYTLVFIIFSFFSAQPISAQYIPLIDKKIFNPQLQKYVDNLSKDQYLFVPNQTVDFQLTVTNTSSADLYNLDITDQLPAQLSYISGGSLDKGGLVHYYIDKLVSGQSQTFLLKTKINVNQNDNSIICPANSAEVKVGPSLDPDTSSFCIQQNINKQVPAVEQLPKTGLPLIAWSLAGLLPLGIGLKRFSGPRFRKDNESQPFYLCQKRDLEKES